MNRKLISLSHVFMALLCFTPAMWSSAVAEQTSTSSSSQSPQPSISKEYFTWLVQNRPWWLNPIITISGGGAFTQIGKTQTLSMPDDYSSYSYAANDKYSSQLLWGGFIGTKLFITPRWDVAVGIGYYQPSAFSSGNGVLTQGVDAPSSNEFLYSYNVKSQQLLAEGKLLWSVKEFIHPYVTAGLGVAFNTAYAYTTNVPPFLTFTPEFTSQTTTAFTYSIGAGVDFDIHKNWRLGVGYRFSDLGKASLGSGYVDTTPFTPVLSQQNVYAQEVVAQLSYLID